MLEILIAVAVVGVIALIVIFSFLSEAHKKDLDSQERQYHIDEMEYFGQLGENYVAESLKIFETVYRGHLINNLIFEDDNGYSSEIDHILITRGGVFIIETKSNKGTIIGNVEDEYWTCIKKVYQDDKKLINPIVQNQRHINHLKRMFKNTPPKMTSMIIFPTADVSQIDSPLVFNLRQAIEKIEELTRSNKYSDEFVERIYKQLEYIRNEYGISKKQHEDNISKNINR